MGSLVVCDVHTMAGVYALRAKITLLYTHGGREEMREVVS